MNEEFEIPEDATLEQMMEWFGKPDHRRENILVVDDLRMKLDTCIWLTIDSTMIASFQDGIITKYDNLAYDDEIQEEED